MHNSEDNSKKNGFFLLVLSISLATFMSSLDGTIVNIALPTISESFDVSTSSVSWVATIYLLVMAGCLLIFGKLSDSVGFKKIFLSGFIVFTAGSFACGFIPDFFSSFDSLIGSRALQAVGGAMITAIAPAMIAAYVPFNMKGKAMGIVMTVASLGMALGPTLGGILTQYLSWHWVFFINVPVGIFAVALGTKVIPNENGSKNNDGFDKKGAFLIFAGLALLLFGISEGQAMGWTNPAIVVSVILALILLALFVFNELKDKNPLLELSLFKSKNFILMNSIVALIFFSFAGINYLMPFYLEYVLGYDTSSAGFILTSLSFSMMIAGILAGLLFNKTGGKKLTILAAFLIAGGYFMMTRLHADTGLSFVIVCLILIGFGLGLLVTPLFNMIMNSTAKNYQGMVSSLTSLERFAPMTIGIAVYNLVLIQGVLAISSHHGITTTTPVNIKLEILSAGFDFAFFIAFIVGMIVFILSFFVKEEVHPDYLEKSDDDSAIMASL